VPSAHRSEDPLRQLRDLHECTLVRRLAKPWKPYFQATRSLSTAEPQLDKFEPTEGRPGAPPLLIIPRALVRFSVDNDVGAVRRQPSQAVFHLLELLSGVTNPHCNLADYAQRIAGAIR